ncbi:MAG TPA: type I-U CRISPR-associated RAMP protein Csb1/Cas7u [Pirellulales bacterium]|jgi:CRISPR-associated protein Csb1|nr:type I-U CRISPR-associated RAMP protein Csb1/Cas7u [Pirellulales bacterium]
MTDLLNKYDRLLTDDGPAAVVMKQWLKPVGDEVIFPPTYANPSQKKGDPPVYNLDRFDGRSACVIDSIPSQANRIEPAFETIADGKLVPQIIIRVDKTAEQVNLLSAGHRAADAIVRFSSLGPDIEKIFRARLKGDSLPLAQLAPTSLVFGVWDSRGGGLKVPRVLNSIIRAYNVDQHTRSAQYVPAIHDYAAAGVAAESGETGLKKLADQGMAPVPATAMLGGVTVHGGICREAALNLCTLRDISTPVKADHEKLQHYILGLSLVALTYFDGKTLNLRQGCQLVADKDKPATRVLVFANGTEQPFEITRDDALAYAQAAAKAFGVKLEPTEGKFDPKLAKDALKKAKKEEG